MKLGKCGIFILTFLVSLLVTDLYAKDYMGPSKGNRDWLKVYYNSDSIMRVNIRPLAEIDSLFYSDDNLNVYSQGESIFSIPVDSINSLVLGGNIPTLYIDTDPYVDEITSKTEYMKARFRYIPYGDGTDSIDNIVSIRGRGNSSWNQPKKPYRLKFDKKQTIGNLNKAKSFVLIANYIDNTLMKNAVAFKIAELLGMPFTNIPMPVNLVFNGKQRGSYMLTNKVGINSGSVDIDEKEGILWELDTWFDEDFKFMSQVTNLPCMVKDPDFYEITGDDEEKVEELWQYWQNDLENTFMAIQEGKGADFIDIDSFVSFFFVNNLVVNGDIRYPKSLYLYKESKDKPYSLGPVWDFDWALGFFNSPTERLLNTSHTLFKAFEKIFKDDNFINKYQEILDNFCEYHLEKLMTFIDDYAKIIRDSALQDALIWPGNFSNPQFAERCSELFDKNVLQLKSFLLIRLEEMKNKNNFSLY